jgi:hypothetical protein
MTREAGGAYAVSVKVTGVYSNSTVEPWLWSVLPSWSSSAPWRP